MISHLTSILFCLLTLWSYSQSTEVKEIKLSIYFDNDSFELTSIHKTKLDSALRANKIQKFKAIGYASSIGAKPYNLSLSKRRAEAVADYLNSNNISGTTEGKGEVLHSAVTLTKQRRVELQLIYKIVPTKIPSTQPIVKNKDLISKDSLIQIITYSDTLSLKSIQFVGGTNSFYPTELPPKDLYYLAEIMDSIPTMEITIQGHVCCGNDLRLSERRAEAVYYVLKKEGIAASRMKVEGYSNTRLKVPDTTPANNQINRRVEIIISKK